MTKRWIRILEICTLLSGVGSVIKIYEFGGKNMKIDIGWVIIAIIFISCIIMLLNEFRKDYKITRAITYQLFLKSEGKRIGEKIGKEIGPDIRKMVHEAFAEAKKKS